MHASCSCGGERGTAAICTSARPHTVVAGVRVGRSAAASNNCLVYERELATLLAEARQQLSLSLLSYAFGLFASLGLGQTRGGRVPYVFAVDQAYQARTR